MTAQNKDTVSFVGVLRREEEQFYLLEDTQEQTPVQITAENFVFMDYAKLSVMTEKDNSFEVTLVGRFDEAKSSITPLYLSYKNQRYTCTIYRSPIKLADIPSEKPFLDYAEIAENLPAWNKKTVFMEATGLDQFFVKEQPSQIHEGYQMDDAKSLMMADHDFVANFGLLDPPKIGGSLFRHCKRIRYTTRIEWLPWYNSFGALNIRDAIIQLEDTRFVRID